MQLHRHRAPTGATGRLSSSAAHPTGTQVVSTPPLMRQQRDRAQLAPAWQPGPPTVACPACSCSDAQPSSSQDAAARQQRPLCSSQRHAQQQQQLRQHVRLRSLGNGANDNSSSKPPLAEPPAASGAPPPPEAAGASSKSSSSSSGTTASSKPAVDSVEDEVDAMLEKVWGNLKRDLKKELPPEQAAMLDDWKSSDIQTDKVFREMANYQLGPFLQSMGIQEDPYDFFLDLFRLSLVFQLGAAALVFYTVELGLGGNAGDAFRAVGGLLLGYTLRLGIKVEQLAWPIYNGLVQLLISEGATYEIPPATPEEQRQTLNKLGVTIAAAFLVPKFVFGWQNDECWQMVVPMVGGLLFFDVAYMFGLLIKLGVGGGGSGGGGGDGDSQD